MEIKFNREHYLTDIGLTQKKIIFLDFNFWIDLLLKKTEILKALYKVIEDGVKQNSLVVPISLGNFWELLKHKDKSFLRDCSFLFDEFSRRIVFRGHSRTIVDEIISLYQNVEKDLDLNEFPIEFGFTLLPDILEDISISWEKPEPATQLDKQMAQLIFNELINQGFYYLASFLDKEERKVRLRTRHSKYEHVMKQTFCGLDRNSFSFEKQVDREIDAIMEVCRWRIDTKMKSLDISLKVKFLAKHDFRMLRRYYFERCPTLHSTALIFAAYVEHFKTYQQNDFYDIENLITVLPYSDIIAVDKHMRHIASNRLKLDTKLKTIVVSTPADLLNSLERIL